MNVHQLILLGRATRDAEVITGKNKKNFAKFSLAVNEYKGKDTEAKTYYYDVLVFGQTADKVAENIKKGDTVMAIGKPEIDAYISKVDQEAKAGITLLAESWKVLK